jgi:sphingomyelin phosphodiesterase acid-like 3
MRYLLFLSIMLLSMMMAFSASSHSKQTAANFLTLADIHFDPFLSCRDVKPCPLIEKLRQAEPSEWPQLFATFDKAMPTYGEDTNYPLFIAGLAAAKHAAEANHAQFVLLLGDFLGHHYRNDYKTYSSDKHLEGYHDFVRKTFIFMTNALNQAFPSLDVYAVVGNNDSYQNDYVTNASGPFFKETADVWGKLIKNQRNRVAMQKQFALAGYYAVDLPAPFNVRLIVLNTNVFSYKGRGRDLSRIAKLEWDWLHQQLDAVKASNQKAFIAMHIPDGIDVYKTSRMHLFRVITLWHESDVGRLQAEIKTYAPHIAGLFAGHLHSDWFHMLAPDTKTEVAMIGTPSVSPIFGNNPGFKIFSYSPNTEQLDDFVTYYYPLSTQRAWGLEYDLNQIVRPDCHPCPSIASVDSLSKGGSVGHFYRLFYSVNVNKPPIPTAWPPYYWCALAKAPVNEDRVCVE